jgi:hypothetical protein
LEYQYLEAANPLCGERPGASENGETNRIATMMVR